LERGEEVCRETPGKGACPTAKKWPERGKFSFGGNPQSVRDDTEARRERGAHRAALAKVRERGQQQRSTTENCVVNEKKRWSHIVNNRRKKTQE